MNHAAFAVLGLDIGGANLKGSHLGGPARSVPFALWKSPERLAAVLQEFVRGFPPADLLAVTMTGELCDCFATSREGVLHILQAVESVSDRSRFLIWTTQGKFEPLEEAREKPLACAASNWLGLAQFAGRFAPAGRALVVDIGSTTSDLIPLLDGQPIPTALTDPERLKAGELVYTGVRRTPLCALLGVGGAAEFFATTLDVYLRLGDIADDPSSTDTADGRPATAEFAHGRLARMLCGDAETITHTATQYLARRIAMIQEQALDRALRQLNHQHGSPETVITSGSGEFLARRLFQGSSASIVSLREKLGPERSDAACATAVATLAAEAIR